MKVDGTTIKRLGFIKYLYNNGIKQSNMPAPMSSASILTFHDVIEQFLILSYEILGGSENTKNFAFMNYWDKIRDLPDGVEISLKGSVKRLKDARVNLKHNGHLINEIDIESHRVTTKNFFEENTPLVFGLEFSEISLIDLVNCDEAKDNMKNAQTNLEEGNLEKSLDSVAMAFFQLIDDYEKRKKDRFGRSPFFFGESMKLISGNSLLGRERAFRDLSKFIDKTKNSIESMRDAMKILSLGIDYRKYTKFRLLTPEIFESFDGPQTRRIQSDFNFKEEDVQFCIDFVIESAIILQEFDFNINHKDQIS